MSTNINDLIDDILLCVISFLPPKDAARTSILCRRWRYFYRRCPSIAFDQRNFGGDEEFRTKRFLNIVSSTLLFYKGESLEQFKLVFNANATYELSNCPTYFDSFLRTAREKNIRSLCLEMSYASSSVLHDKTNKLNTENEYCLPSYIFKCASLQMLILKDCTLGTLGSPSLQNLVVLHLIRVESSKQSIQELITNCISLRELAVEGCPLLEKLQISLLKLETLSVRCCHQMKSLRINAPNLFSLNFEADLFNKLDFKFLKPEELRCVRLGLCQQKEYINGIIFELPEPLSSLTRAKEFTKFAMELLNAKNLSLASSSFEDFAIEELLQFAPLQLHKVKHLSLKGWIGSRKSILGVSILLALMPSIESLILEFTENTTEKPQDSTVTDEEPIDFPSIDCLNYTLKRITLRNFVGDEAELILLKHFLEHAVFLDEIRIGWGKEKHVNLDDINMLKNSKSINIID
ncbi:F-box/RNI-like/FBD-like domains-containing protein [Rhynchospora pubera]|uniref:F-box/RNI-like/FBD-like domains-containing protein n=1 Tax=Rhynchospora pubera TaxID=906938 RepID=A0AAV8CJV2_9POAL|nr:F-box/RNI-like/FBD-like domains-containing protein [Rhynchospora pubera]